jgi:hypothetical protein
MIDIGSFAVGSDSLLMGGCMPACLDYGDEGDGDHDDDGGPLRGWIG